MLSGLVQRVIVSELSGPGWPKAEYCQHLQASEATSMANAAPPWLKCLSGGPGGGIPEGNLAAKMGIGRGTSVTLGDGSGAQAHA